MADWMKKIYIRINDNYEMMYPYNLKDKKTNFDMIKEKKEIL